MKIANLFLLGAEFVVLFALFLGTPWGYLTFGSGLGDVLYIFFYLAICLSHAIASIALRKWKMNDSIFIVLLCCFLPAIPWCIYMCSYGRGVEHRWDGEIFAIGCAHYIPIITESGTKKKRISMCSMVYYAQIVGKPIEKGLMLLEYGTIKVPDELKSDIKQPITKFYVEPRMTGTWNDTTKVSKEIPEFSVDTLRVKESYIFTGEICKIINGVPVLEVSLREKGWISPI
jgi:hypothetical protein